MAKQKNKNGNVFYEQYHESANRTLITRNENVIFPPHFHMNVEVFISKRGNFEVTLNGEKYTVKNNCVLFCSSYDVHSYDKSFFNHGENEEFNHAVVLIPPVLLKDFYAGKRKDRPIAPVVQSEKLCDALLEICDRLLSDKTVSPVIEQAAINLFLAYIESEFDFSDKNDSRSPNVLRDMLEFISHNYREKISLQIIAKNLGYSPEHLSRLFHLYFNRSVSSYINGMRLDYIDNALKTDGDSRKISDLAFEAGFQSIQSYYRVKNNSKQSVKN